MSRFKVFQFPANLKPSIDGNPADWNIVPDSYAITMSEFMDTETGPWHESRSEEAGREDQGRVGEGENRLYFLYEATKGYWDFLAAGIAQRHFRSGRGRPIFPAGR